MHVDYIGTVAPGVTRDDLRDDGCQRMQRRIRDGLWIEEDHCPLCTERVRACKPIVYRVRDTNGRVITADWTYWR